MIKKIFQLFILLLLLNGAVYSLTIHIAPIIYYADTHTGAKQTAPDFRELLTNALESLFRWEKISFQALESRIDTPRSFMDAMRICTEYKLDYLLYGFVEVREYALYGEVKLFDRQKQEVVQVFYASDNLDAALRLSADLAAKIAGYFKTLLGVELSGEEQPFPDEGIFTFSAGAGYWTPLTAEWAQYIQPLYDACLAVGFIPWRPAEGGGWRGFYFKTGLNCAFYHSINRAGYEEMNLYTFTIGIPLYVSFDIGVRHTISLGIEPQFAVDYLERVKLYADWVKTPVLLFSGAVNLEYWFHFTRQLSVGIGNVVTVQFINPLRLSYNPVLLFEVSLNPLFPGEKNNAK